MRRGTSADDRFGRAPTIQPAWAAAGPIRNGVRMRCLLPAAALLLLAACAPPAFDGLEHVRGTVSSVRYHRIDHRKPVELQLGVHGDPEIYDTELWEHYSGVPEDGSWTRSGWPRVGDAVELWVDGDEIWQLRSGGRMLISYDERVGFDRYTPWFWAALVLFVCGPAAVRAMMGLPPVPKRKKRRRPGTGPIILE